jgi:hypothetical protein
MPQGADRHLLTKKEVIQQMCSYDIAALVGSDVDLTEVRTS